MISGYESGILDADTLEAKDDVSINLTYADAYDIILDGLRAEASIEPLNEGTFALNAENLLGLLVGASEDFEAKSEKD